MKTLTFTYTKKDGSVSSRTILALVEPTDKFAGIDLSEMDPTEASNFAAYANELHEKYVAALNELQVDYDLKHNYRQFLASGVSDLNVI